MYLCVCYGNSDFTLCYTAIVRQKAHRVCQLMKNSKIIHQWCIHVRFKAFNDQYLRRSIHPSSYRIFEKIRVSCNLESDKVAMDYGRFAYYRSKLNNLCIEVVKKYLPWMLTSRNNNKAVWAVEYTKWQYHLSSITKSNHLLIYITIP